MFSLLDCLRHAEGRLDLPARAKQYAGPRLAPRHQEGAVLRGPAGVSPLLPPDLGWGAPPAIREWGAGVPSFPLVASSTSLQSYDVNIVQAKISLWSAREKIEKYIYGYGL